MPEASHQLHRVPNAQESEAQKQRQGSQQGVVLVDLDRQTDRQTPRHTYLLPSSPCRRPGSISLPISLLPALRVAAEASGSSMPTACLGHSARTPSLRLVRPWGFARPSPGFPDSRNPWRSREKKLGQPLPPWNGVRNRDTHFLYSFIPGLWAQAPAN